MRKQNIKVTTTSTFENINITEYLEPITAHVVIGMNMFKDFITGFTDTFGGNSNMYENTLNSMNQEVISKLMKKAHSIGANCIIGLKIDNDEISAQGKSMMMVSATGTAAIGQFPKKPTITVDNERRVNSLSSEDYLILNQKKIYQKQCEEKKMKVRQNDEFWEFIKRHRMSDFSDFVINSFEDSMNDYLGIENETTENHKNNLIEYFSLIDSDISKRKLYDKLNNGQNQFVRDKIEDIIVKTYLIDYQEILKLLNNDSFKIQKSTFKLCTYQKISYEYFDIKEINDIVEFLKGNFAKRGEITTKKKLLSSKSQDIWICECKKENDDNTKYCNKCGKDIYGFLENEIKPDDLIKVLENKVEILTEILKT